MQYITLFVPCLTEKILAKPQSNGSQEDELKLWQDRELIRRLWDNLWSQQRFNSDSASKVIELIVTV